MPTLPSSFAPATLLAMALLPPSSATAQDTGFDWQNATEFSFVSAAGNSSSNTLGLKSTLTGSAETSSFKLEIGGIRASSTLKTRIAQGTVDNYTVTEQTVTAKSAENYFARTRYTHDVGSAFAFGGGGWERNTFAGVRHRFSFVGGLGKTWVEGDSGLFKTDLGATYTIQKDIEEDPAKKNGFGGMRATIEAERALTSTAELASTLVVDENLRSTDDLRVDWSTSLSVALTEGLALKTSYQLLFDNDPALIGVPLFDMGTAAGQVRVPSEKIDSYVTLSLVIKL